MQIQAIVYNKIYNIPYHHMYVCSVRGHIWARLEPSG